MTAFPKYVTGNRAMLGLVLVALVSCDSADVVDPSGVEPVAAAAAARGGTPGAVTDLRVVNATSSTITVAWTAVSDGRGGAAKYALRASAPPISWSASAATEVRVDAKPVGQTVTYTYRNAPPNTKAEFRLVSYRGTLNTSNVVLGPLSNIAAGSTLSSDATPTPEPDTTTAPPDTTVTTPPDTVVSPPPTDGGDATYPNRPSGMTLIGRNDGTVKESGGRAFGIAGFGNWYDHNVASDIAVVNDPTNPTGSGKSLRFTYPSNDDKAGSARANTFAGGPYRQLYIMMRIFLEPSGWDTFGNKFFYVGAASRSTSSPTQFYTDRPGGATLRVVNQYVGNYVVANSSKGSFTNPLQQGQWLNVEYLFTSETAPGAGNGRLTMWVNGREVATNTAVSWTTSGTLGFTGMEWYAEVNDIPKTSYYRLGELYIAGRN